MKELNLHRHGVISRYNLGGILVNKDFRKDMHREEKDILKMIEIVCEEITVFVKNNKIDTVINPASPTLMGGEYPSVDYDVHREINKSFVKKSFKDKIRRELDGKNNWGEDIIRCERGKAVITKGYSLCRNVIHVVGPEYDGVQIKWCLKRKNSKLCTSSCVQKLEACYREIIKEIKCHPDIKKVAIPIIGSGNYGIPFELAAKVAVATVANELVDWKNKDSELFEIAALENIYFCTYHPKKEKKQDCYNKVKQIWDRYKKVIIYDKKVVYQNSVSAHFRYLLEVVKHDGERGYFAVAKLFRLLLLMVRTVFIPILLFKDLLGGCNWHKRRTVVEMTAFLKLSFPIMIYLWIWQCGLNQHRMSLIRGCIVYFMFDTISYLLLLIVLSDIQRPSANVIRSMIFLLINYLEVSFDLAIIFYVHNYGTVQFRTAIQFGIMPDFLSDSSIVNNTLNMSLLYLNNGIKFFFITLAFGYFANHLRQREFLS